MAMWLVMALLAGQAAAPAETPSVSLPDLAPVIVQAPGPEAMALAAELARAGTLASLLPLIAAKETEELVAAHPELTPAERERLRATAQTIFAAGRDRLFAATAHEYARRMTLADLRQQVSVARLPSSQRLRQVQPAAIVGTMQAMQAGSGIDFKRDTLAAFCKDTGKACGPAK